jgi:hypothetical protein
MTSDPPDPIAAAAARYKRDNDKALASRKELTSLVLDALREPDAKPIDIAKRAEWTPAYVRKLARDNDIQAAADYKARTEKARARLIAEASASPATAAPRQQVTQAVPEPLAISTRVAALLPERAKELAEAAEARHPDWVEEIRQAHPNATGRRIHYLIVEAGLREGFRPPELGEQTESEKEQTA